MAPALRRLSTITAGPLSGLRVVDLSRILAGPYCCQMLGDMGAEVIKIEQPGGGDETRRWGPPFIEGESSYFLSVNRNKRSLAVDLKHKEGVDIIKRLVAVSDVLVENFLPGKMEQLGLGYESLKEINPKVVYCSISGFGATGPLSMKPGYDALASAMYGMIHITGEKGGKGVKPGVAITDVLTGLLANGGILAALRERDLSGLGQHVDTSLMEAQLSSLVNVASNFLTTGIDNSKRYGTAHPSIVPYQAFTCSDGKSIMICIGSDTQFKSLCDSLGMPDLAGNTLYRTNDLRVKNRDRLVSLIESVFLSQPLDVWMKQFSSYHFPFGPVRSIKESFDDPQAQFRNMSVSVDHPRCGPIKVVGPPVKFSRTPSSIRLPPPLLGQHTVEILKEILDFKDSTISELKDKHIIQ